MDQRRRCVYGVYVCVCVCVCVSVSVSVCEKERGVASHVWRC